MRFPVFIVGMPRSGTTLVRVLLNAHPDIAIAPETHFYTRCGVALEAGESPQRAWKCLEQQPGFQSMDFTCDEIDRIRSRLSEASHPKSVLEAVGTVYAEREGAEAWGEKTPDHLAHAARILHEFPGAVVLAMIRDPRDVCLSLAGLPWNRDTLVESAWKWRRYQQLLQRYRASFKDRVYTVRYEDVLEAPSQALKDILDWLDAHNSESTVQSMLQFYERRDPGVDSDREPWKEKTRRPIDSTNREKWRTQMAPAHQWVVQRIAGPLLEECGYADPSVRLNRYFWADLMRLIAESAAKLLERWQGRLRAGRRRPGDHTPEWIRRP